MSIYIKNSKKQIRLPFINCLALNNIGSVKLSEKINPKYLQGPVFNISNSQFIFHGYTIYIQIRATLNSDHMYGIGYIDSAGIVKFRYFDISLFTYDFFLYYMPVASPVEEYYTFTVVFIHKRFYNLEYSLFMLLKHGTGHKDSYRRGVINRESLAAYKKSLIPQLSFSDYIHNLQVERDKEINKG